MFQVYSINHRLHGFYRFYTDSNKEQIKELCILYRKYAGFKYHSNFMNRTDPFSIVNFQFCASEASQLVPIIVKVEDCCQSSTHTKIRYPTVFLSERVCNGWNNHHLEGCKLRGHSARKCRITTQCY